MNRTVEIAKAREVDTRIAAAWSEYHIVADKVADAKKSISNNEKTIKMYMGRRNAEHVINSLTRRNADLESMVAELTVQAALLAENAQAIDDAEYTGWTRFFLVKHIHNTTHCSSFRPTTRIGWLPDVSGLTEVEAVKEHGETLCTICFPSAPTELTTKQAPADQCSGSGKAIDWSLPNRRGFYSGNWATCPDCQERVSITNSSRSIRKHKA